MTRLLPPLIALTATISLAGDWLTIGGDPQHSGWQHHGQRVTAENANQTKLLWRRKPVATPLLTTPIILGPTVTHRGVRELVFVAAADTLFAIDADFGTLFWTRHFASDAPSVSCTTNRMAMPLIQPDLEEDYAEFVPDDEDDDDEPANMRPLYVLATDGRLFTLRPTDGADIELPRPLLTPGIRAALLNYEAGHAMPAEAAPCTTKYEPANVRRAATWTDAAGTRWTYTPTVNGIEATAAGRPRWSVHDLANPGPPAIAHGVVFTLTNTALFAFDAATGKQLYKSSESIVPVPDHEIAVANGHVVFNAQDNTVYCFGVPIER